MFHLTTKDIISLCCLQPYPIYQLSKNFIVLLFYNNCTKLWEATQPKVIEFTLGYDTKVQNTTKQ